MSEQTKIQWATHTFNPWIGCTKVSPGCKNCYAEMTTRARVLRKRGQETWGKGAKRSRTSEATWRHPIQWNKIAWICEMCGAADADGVTCRAEVDKGTKTNPFIEPCGSEDFYKARVFPSLCDWLDDEVPIEWLADFLELVFKTPNLDWLLLTKRPENWRSRLTAAIGVMHVDPLDISDRIGEWVFGKRPPKNVWLGTSVENQAMADKRIPELLKIPARVRFLSVEPLLEQVNLRFKHPFDGDAIFPCPDWVIVGGESGPMAGPRAVRPCNAEWIRGIVQQCQTANVPVFVKQLGARPVKDIQDARGKYCGFEGLSLKDPKGGDLSEWPEDLKVRDFPK